MMIVMTMALAIFMTRDLVISYCKFCFFVPGQAIEDAEKVGALSLACDELHFGTC